MAEDITIRVHGEDALARAIEASQALFSKTIDGIKNLSSEDFLDVFEGVQQATVSKADITDGLGIIDALSSKTGFLESNGAARRELKANSISVNKSKVTDEFLITQDDLMNDKYVLLGKGKKTNFILIVE